MNTLEKLKSTWRSYKARKRALRRLNRALKDGIVHIDIKDATGGIFTNLVVNHIHTKNCKDLVFMHNTVLGPHDEAFEIT